MTRWRDRPRRTLRRWDLHRSYIDFAFLPVLLAIGGTVAVGQALFDDVSVWSRVRLATGGLAALAGAAVLARVVWLYLRRPLIPEDRPGPAVTPDDVRLRNDPERSAREHRGGL